MIALFISLLVPNLASARDWVEIPGPKYRGKDLVLPGIVQKPEGEGPFPAVIIAHGCQGIQEQSDGRWAARLNEMGYAVLMVDSFRPRGYLESCNLNVTQSDRARDAHAARRWLAGQPYIKQDSIGLLGISHGGFGALSAVNAANYPNDKPFQAVFALYPYCGSTINMLGSPLRVVIGDADAVVPPEMCRDMKIRHLEGHEYQLSEYPGATHYFDVEDLVLLKLRWPNRSVTPGAPDYVEVTMKHDHALTQKLVNEVKAFFGAHLK